jgi:hypothetical protein
VPDLYPTPEDKRRMAESIGTFSPESATDWYAAAALQEVGAKAAYDQAVKDWKAAKPRQWEFLPPEARADVEAFRARVGAAAKAEFESTWGSLLDRGRDA